MFTMEQRYNNKLSKRQIKHDRSWNSEGIRKKLRKKNILNDKDQSIPSHNFLNFSDIHCSQKLLRHEIRYFRMTLNLKNPTL